MNTEEIKNYLETNEYTRDIFLNVYAMDQLPKEKISRTTVQQIFVESTQII